MPNWNKVPDEKIADMYRDHQGGLTYQQIAHRYKVHASTVQRIIAEIRHGKRHVVITVNPTVPAEPPTAPPETAIVKHAGRPNGSKYAHLIPEVIKLKQEGYSTREIAEKTGMSKAAVGYYFTKLNRGIDPTKGESNNGQSPLDTRFLIGYGCAELDRACDAIAQRLGISTNLLRSGFSKLLGGPAVR